MISTLDGIPNLYDDTSWSFHNYPIYEVNNNIYDSSIIQVHQYAYLDPTVYQSFYFCPRDIPQHNYLRQTFLRPDLLEGKTVDSFSIVQ